MSFLHASVPSLVRPFVGSCFFLSFLFVCLIVCLFVLFVCLFYLFVSVVLAFVIFVTSSVSGFFVGVVYASGSFLACWLHWDSIQI
jgi:hypothetical protein